MSDQSLVQQHIPAPFGCATARVMSLFRKCVKLLRSDATGKEFIFQPWVCVLKCSIDIQCNLKDQHNLQFAGKETEPYFQYSKTKLKTMQIIAKKFRVRIN